MSSFILILSKVSVQHQLEMGGSYTCYLLSSVFLWILECWTAPLRESDKRPPPLGGHRMAKIDEERAAMFGGTGPGKNGRSNDLWVLNLDQSVSLSLSAKCTVPIFKYCKCPQLCSNTLTDLDWSS